MDKNFYLDDELLSVDYDEKEFVEYYNYDNEIYENSKYIKNFYENTVLPESIILICHYFENMNEKDIDIIIENLCKFGMNVCINSKTLDINKIILNYEILFDNELYNVYVIITEYSKNITLELMLNDNLINKIINK